MWPTPHSRHGSTDTHGEKMSQELSYGENGRVRVDLARGAILADCAIPRGTPLDDPAAAVAAAVSDPIEFPPLASATVPGDRVVLALDQSVPRAADIVAGVIHTLLGGSAQPHEISIVLADGDWITDPISKLPASVAKDIQVSVHDPQDSTKLSYLAASREGKPIYFNKQVCDADVVIPISTLRLEQALGYLGVHGGLFPAFSDEATRRRFRAPSSQDWEVHRRRRREEVDEAAWLLGVQFTIQVAPGPGDTVLHVLAGEAHAVAAKGRSLCEAAWMHTSPRRANLVVATIEGGPDQQTWENFGRALFAASRAVLEGGAILLCTDLKCSPGPALQRLTAADDEDSALRDIRRDRSSDAVSASLLAEAKRQARIYLLSGLDSDFVEDLGVGYVSRPDEVTNLSRHFESCILLGNAQHAVLSTVEE